ncbi:MAG TPA: polysaccharide biosynthesis/export family protein [Pyrinomonadaceae bacterium]|nr:polysaccharide biosynthesis/export family protein [Pyrinomonadaceae bacterium]
MKNIITVIALSLVLTTLSIVTFGQTSSEPKKARSTSSQGDESVATTSTLSSTISAEPAIATKSPNTNEATVATDIYRVGPGDVLDIRLMNSVNANRSTLFTVVAGGMIDFPLAGGPIQVSGLTTEEIQTRLSTELKRRAVEENAQVSVGVRQYLSHSVMVTGLVGSPGTRILRREAVPLYVILAESQLRNDAGTVVIMRNGTTGQPLNLNDPQSLNTTVISGDVITVSTRPQEFYYIAGGINYPGQKNFHEGITLLQAILAAGGTVKKSDAKVEISRDTGKGRLVTTRFDLKQIKVGGMEDPKLQPGDRIEVLR